MIYSLLSAIVNAWLLPPGLFILALFAAAAVARRYRWLFASLALLLWFLSSSLGANLLLWPLESASFPKPKGEPVAVVVLGGGEIDGAPHLPLSGAGIKRLLWGIGEARRREIGLIYSGCEEGAGQTIKEITQRLGVDLRECSRPDPGCYLIENESQNSYQNAKYTKALFQRLRLSPAIVLVTSASHMPRSHLLFRRFGFEVEAQKSDFLVKTFEPKDLLPSVWGLERSVRALHEYLGLIAALLLPDPQADGSRDNTAPRP